MTHEPETHIDAFQNAKDWKHTDHRDLDVREFGIISFIGLLLLIVGLVGFGWYLADLVRIIF